MPDDMYTYSEPETAKGGTWFSWEMFLFGGLVAVAAVLLLQTDSLSSNKTIVFNAPAIPRLVAVLSTNVLEEVEKQRALEYSTNEEGEGERQGDKRATQEESTFAETVPPISAVESYKAAQVVLATALSQLVDVLRVRQSTFDTATSSSERNSSIKGPWDSFWWIGDKPGVDDQTPGVQKMYFAPIQGAGGEGSSGGSGGSSGGDSGGDEGGDGGDGGGDDGGGDDLGGGPPGGGPPGGGPGGGPF